MNAVKVLYSLPAVCLTALFVFVFSLAPLPVKQTWPCTLLHKRSTKSKDHSLSRQCLWFHQVHCGVFSDPTFYATSSCTELIRQDVRHRNGRENLVIKKKIVYDSKTSKQKSLLHRCNWWQRHKNERKIWANKWQVGQANISPLKLSCLCGGQNKTVFQPECNTAVESRDYWLEAAHVLPKG